MVQFKRYSFVCYASFSEPLKHPWSMEEPTGTFRTMAWPGPGVLPWDSFYSSHNKTSTTKKGGKQRNTDMKDQANTQNGLHIAKWIKFWINSPNKNHLWSTRLRPLPGARMAQTAAFWHHVFLKEVTPWGSGLSSSQSLLFSFFGMASSARQIYCLPCAMRKMLKFLLPKWNDVKGEEGATLEKHHGTSWNPTTELPLSCPKHPNATNLRTLQAASQEKNKRSERL